MVGELVINNFFSKANICIPIGFILAILTANVLYFSPTIEELIHRKLKRTYRQYKKVELSYQKLALISNKSSP